MNPVYLDNAATTPMDPEVIKAMIPFMETYFGNPSSSHSFGRKTKTAIEQSRRKIASLLNCAPAEICFTSGGTEADNLAIRSAVKDLDCTRIITTSIEHSAVIKTADNIQSLGKAEVLYLNLDEKGHVDLRHLEELLSNGKGKALVSLMHGNNEIANILPIKEVSLLCKKYNAVFHSDTVQTMGHYAFDLQDLEIDFLTCAAHKLHGPKGIGFLYVNKNLKIKPLIIGGGQERQLRGGTENLYGIVGLAKALEIANRELEAHKIHVSGLKQYMIQRCSEEIHGTEFNGDSANPDSLYTVLNMTFPPCENAGMMLFLLDLEGIACSGGSACSSGAAKGSHVLESINAIKDGRASLRFSFSRFTTKNDIDSAVEKLMELCTVKELVS